MSRARLHALRAKLKEKSLDGFLILRPENRRYLSGFTGSSGVLLITLSDAYLLTDFRYQEQAKKQAPHFQLVKTKGPFIGALKDLIVDLKVKMIGFEADFITFDTYQLLTEKTPSAWQGKKGLVEALRAVKDEAELRRIEQAVALADAGFSYILEHIKPGVRELDLALALEFFMRRKGASAPSFEFIVASGPRSSLPHGVASNRVMQRGDLVTLDFGCIFEGYCSDMTRTVVLGPPSPEQEKVYQTVLDAQLKGIEAILPGRKAVDVDATARKHITDQGYGDHFGHGLGHGVGLAIHEAPNLGPTSPAILEEGMVVTIEPGIYLPGWGGVRIEDMAVVTKTGRRVLTQTTKRFLSL